MNRALEDLSKSDLISLLKEKEKSVSNLQHRLLKKDQIIAQFQRMLFGQKRERFEGDPAQGSLPFEATGQQKQEQETLYEKAISYVRKRKSAPNHKGRLPLPDHLPVEELEIHPEGGLSEVVCIGKQVTDELELEPARFYIKRYIRYKYAPKDQSTDVVRIGELPERVIDKGIPGPGLLTTILVDKYVDHLPLYRQRQRFTRENIPIASSTLEGWAARAMDHLQILYDHLARDTKTQGYLQADETPIKVLQTRNKGSTHQGWYWVYHNPINKATLFDYRPTRGHDGAEGILKGFKGYLQTDGYSSYEKIGSAEDVIHLGCWTSPSCIYPGLLMTISQTIIAYCGKLRKMETGKNGSFTFYQP